MNTQNTPNQAEHPSISDTMLAIIRKLKAQQSELDRLKTEVAALQTQILPLLNPESPQPQTKPNPRPTPRAPSSIYLPELDYLLWITYLRDEFREGQKSGGKTTYLAKQYVQDPNKPKIIYGYTMTDIDAAPKQVTYTMPTASVRQDLTFQYGVRYQDDFRYTGTQAVYVRGVYDRNNGGTLTGTSSCATFNKTTSFKANDLIHNTREHWQSQTDEQKRMRIVDEDEMFQILERMEAGTHLPGQGTWCMVEPRDLMAKETDDTYWLSPRKVRLL